MHERLSWRASEMEKRMQHSKEFEYLNGGIWHIILLLGFPRAALHPFPFHQPLLEEVGRLDETNDLII